MLDLGVHVSFSDGFALQEENSWLGFINEDKECLTYSPHTFELYFETENLDDFYKKIENCPDTKLFSPIIEHDWGQRSFRFYDLDNHLIEIGESMKIVVKRFLQLGYSIEEAAKKSMFPKEFVEICQKELVNQ